MGHSIQAYIAKSDVMRDAVGDLRSARLIPVEQGFALLLNTDDFRDEVGGGRSGVSPYEEFYGLSQELAVFGAKSSARGPVAYVETDYFGGEGEQAAVLWERGEIACGPARARLGPINDVLRRMGVGRGGHFDEFEALGLHRHRNNDDWMGQSRRPADLEV